MSRENALPEARALRGALLRAEVPEVSIEVMEGRPAGGDRWNNQFVVTDTAHHTASRYSRDNLTPCLSLVKKGRGGSKPLPGPLCNGYGGWDLCARIITLGYANHPGQGGPLTVPSGVKKPPSYTIPKDSGRKYMFGWEFEGGIREADWDLMLTNPRNGVKMTMREFMARCLNGTQDQYNLPLGAHTEHKTWAPTRKVDRAGYTLTRAEHEMTKWKVTPPPAPRPPTTTDTHTVRIVTANIKDNPDMADRLVRADVREVRELGGWLLFQEIGEREDHLALTEVLGPDWDVHFPHLAVPIAVKDHFRVVDEGRLKLHDGKAGVSPARYLTWLDLNVGGALDPILMNTHWVSGAWSSPAKPHQDWRQAMWNLSWRTTKAKIEEFNQAGRTVILGGDFNRAAFTGFTDRWRWLGQHGIDKIGCSNPVARPNITVVGTPRHIDLNSDHDALQVTISWPK
jgi:hypothetical protein